MHKGIAEGQAFCELTFPFYTAAPTAGDLLRSVASVVMTSPTATTHSLDRPMREIWLQTNMRLRNTLLGVCVVCDLLATGMLVVGWQTGASTTVMIVLGAFFLAAQSLSLAWAAICAPPRIAFEPGWLLLHLRWVRPIRVPIEVVEAFLLGQGPTMLPGASRDLETSTLVVKLADRAEEWQKVDVARPIAAWCNSYVTIRGTWCEPLDVQVVNRLNHRLSEVQPSRHQQARA